MIPRRGDVCKHPPKAVRCARGSETIPAVSPRHSRPSAGSASGSAEPGPVSLRRRRRGRRAGNRTGPLGRCGLVPGQRVLDEGIGDPRINLQNQLPDDVVIDLALPFQRTDPSPRHPEIGEPVDPLFVPIDRVSKLPLVPQPSCQDRAAVLGDQIGDLLRDGSRIAGILRWIEDEHPFVHHHVARRSSAGARHGRAWLS